MTRLLRAIPSEISRKADRDALFVLLISILALIGSAGGFLALIMVRILYLARTAPCSLPAPDAVGLVFGKQLVNNHPDPEYIARLDRLIDCGIGNAILMGGRSPGNDISEALAGLRYLQMQGISMRSVHLEQDSRSTLENLRNSRELIRKRTAVIISSRYHLSRCSILAKSFTIRHELCAAEADFPFNAKTLAKCLIEAFYIHWFYSGKYWATLTRNRRMIAKIT